MVYSYLYCDDHEEVASIMTHKRPFSTTTIVNCRGLGVKKRRVEKEADIHSDRNHKKFVLMILMTRWVPCASASSDELTTSTSHVAPLEVTLIHSNKNRSQGTPAFSSPRALAASPVLRYLLYPARSSDLLPYNIICSRIRSRLWCARRGAPMTNFIPRSHRRSRPPPPFTRARGSMSRSGRNRRREFRLLTLMQIPTMTNMPYSIPSHPPICAWRP